MITKRVKEQQINLRGVGRGGGTRRVVTQKILPYVNMIEAEVPSLILAIHVFVNLNYVVSIDVVRVKSVGTTLRTGSVVI